MNNFLFLLLMAIMLIIFFAVAAGIVMLYTGCDFKSAIKKVQKTLNNEPEYHIEHDMALQNEISNNVRAVIDEMRFNKLVETGITSETALIYFGNEKKLPYIAITVNPLNLEEKKLLKRKLIKVVKAYLQIYGHSQKVLAIWTHRNDLNMAVLKIYFSKSEEEEKRLQQEIQRSIKCNR